MNATAHELLDWAIPSASALATWVVAYTGYIRPRRIESERLKNVEAEHRRDRLSVLDGVKEVPGLIDGVPPLAIRIHKVEAELRENTAAVSLMALRQNQANGTMQEIREMVKVIFDTCPVVPHVKEIDRR